MFFSIDHQSTSNDRLKPVLTTGLVNMHIDQSIANLVIISTTMPDGPAALPDFIFEMAIFTMSIVIVIGCPSNSS